MALVTPIAQQRTAFDATKEAYFYFTIDDSGDKIVASYIEIIDQADNSRVYWNKQETDQRYHILPANTSGMVNGHYYYYRIKTYNASGQESLFSNSVPFYCYSTPIITMTNLPSGEVPVIATNNFEFQFTYAQNENELLNYIRLDISIVRTDEQGNETFDGVYTSGNILANEANEYSAMVYGLVNEEIYILDVVGVTVNGTEFSLHSQNDGVYQRFTISSSVPEYYSQISVEAKCDKGYVKVAGNLVITDGESLYEPQYIGDESNKKIILLPRHSYVKWTEGFSIQQSFTLGIWGKIGQAGEILTISNDRNDVHLKLSYNRGYINGVSEIKDFIEMNIIDENGNIMLYMISNLLSPLKPNEDYLVFFQLKDMGNISLQFIKLASADFEWRWNLPSQVYYGQMLPQNWVNEDWKHYNFNSSEIGEIVFTDYFDLTKLQSMIPLTKCKLSNGIYDQIDITNDTEITPENYNPIWTAKTILNANFNGNISGGNTNIILSEVGYLRIKRRQVDSTKWITLKEIPVSKPEDFKIEYIDTCVPSGVEQIYAIVPVDPNRQETEISTYITASTGDFRWNGVFVSIGTDIMKFFSKVQYTSITKNREVGVLNPIANKYPIVLQNGKTSYLSGTLSTLVLGEDYEANGRVVNRLSVVAQLTKIHEWLDRGQAIVVKDWNGWIVICKPTSGDTVTFDGNYGNGVATASFNFVEQGKYNIQEDLYETGIIDYEE